MNPFKQRVFEGRSPRWILLVQGKMMLCLLVAVQLPERHCKGVAGLGIVRAQRARPFEFLDRFAGLSSRSKNPPQSKSRPGCVRKSAQDPAVHLLARFEVAFLKQSASGRKLGGNILWIQGKSPLKPCRGVF